MARRDPDARYFCVSLAATSMNGAGVDSFITSFRRTRARKRGAHESSMRYVRTKAALLRVVDTGGSKPALVLTPDGPCVIEHYEVLIERFSERFRVVCFDIPGMEFSFPSRGYRLFVASGAPRWRSTATALSRTNIPISVPSTTRSRTHR